MFLTIQKQSNGGEHKQQADVSPDCSEFSLFIGYKYVLLLIMLFLLTDMYNHCSATGASEAGANEP